MKKILLPVATAAALAMTASPATAQRANTLVVDLNQLLNTCTACQAAAQQIQAQAQQLRTRAQQLETELSPERDAIAQAVQALNGRQPDNALQQRIANFRQRSQAAQTELQNSERNIESTRAHVQQQLGQRIVQISEQVRARRNASVVISKEALLANDSNIDVTGEVLQALNQQLPSVSVTPLPQQQQQPQPQGR